MFSRSQLRILWIAIIAALLVGPFLTTSELGQTWAAWYPSIWVHFLAYAAVVAISLSAKGAKKRAASLVVVALIGVGLEPLLHALTPQGARHSFLLPNIYGMAAGFLLSCNIKLAKFGSRRREGSTATGGI